MVTSSVAMAFIQIQTAFAVMTTVVAAINSTIGAAIIAGGFAVFNVVIMWYLTRHDRIERERHEERQEQVRKWREEWEAARKIA